MGGANLSLVPTAPAPWTIMDGPQRGQPTPDFYRFIISLLGLAGGNVPATLAQLEALFFSQAHVSPTAVSNLVEQVALLQAELSLARLPGPDLRDAMAGLSAQMALLRRPGDDLTNAVQTLTALLMLLPRSPVLPNVGRTPFTPAVSFGTPGDLGVVYTTRTGAYAKSGPLIAFWISLAFTPTYTTASGNFLIGTLPILPLDASVWAADLGALASPVWPGVTDTTVNGLLLSNGQIQLQGLKSGAAASNFTATQIVSGVAYTVQLSGTYF